ncbi:DNA-packaging protein [Hyphomicrobium facile]|uniref:Large terminase phage packaging protein n=1 Tax=Hyphomicrobium facile TaxID=51670 RepID=A0A1I7NB27_9HYPH|nr:terminase family protein [Hyphomicrobium facile]SFV31882.1 Large terminase phage packaging protein [Hyphomicrobium facile]
MRKTYAAKLRNVLNASITSGRLSEILNELSADELEFISHDWELWARDEQLAPALIVQDSRNKPAPCGRLPAGESPSAIKSWRVWLLLGGRGSGKTRAGAEWVRSLALSSPMNEATSPRPAAGSRNASRRAPTKDTRIALVGKTLADVRNVMIEGQSGLLAIHPPRERPLFEPSKRRLTWPNGAVAELFSADEAEALRGPQFTAAWCDELAKWRGAERAWDMLQFALRLGEAPRVCVTTTPRATKLLKQIIADEATVTVNLATADNATNLAPTFLAEMTRRYAGSAIGRQELLGEIVEDASDGLWRRHWIEEARVENAPEMQRVVVALDPPVTATASSDACGIVVAGLGVDKRAYVLADRTIQGRTPELWARAALGAYDDFEADRMVAEVNQGGDLVISVLQQFRENFPVVKVRATRGKWVRAEPVAALYAEGRVAHVGRFDALEDQMCAFGSDGTVKGRSPDRADALVWALTDLLLGDTTKPSVRML